LIFKIRNINKKPRILVGCSWIIKPEKPEQFAGMAKCVFDHPLKVSKSGLKVRGKCKKEYGWEVVEKYLVGVFAKSKYM